MRSRAMTAESNDLSSLEPLSSRRPKWIWGVFLPIALIHLAYAFCADFIVWQCIKEDFRGHMTPFGMNLAPYLPGCILLQYGRTFDPHELDYCRGMNADASQPIMTLGILLIVAGSLATGLFTATTMGRLIRKVPRPWGRYSWRLCVSIILWIGWFAVPTKMSLYYQFAHWEVGLRLLHP